jgi:hypothetical protein
MGNESMKGLKGVTVYMTEHELDALRHIKRKSFYSGKTISISGMLRHVAVDRILEEGKTDVVVQNLLEGKYDEV